MPSLAHRVLGDEEAPPLVVLHGLLGSMRNWLAVGRLLAHESRVYLLDLRNHGESPHIAGSGFDLQAADVRLWMNTVGLDAAHVLGHSMGGKVAMRLACEHPARVSRLTVVDIAPRGYSPVSVELEALLTLDSARLGTRIEAAERLASAIPDEEMRRFLVTNLVPIEGGGFRWRINLAELVRGLPEIRSPAIGPRDRYAGATQVITGARSTFVKSADHALFHEHFPNCRIETISGCGHNPHVEAKAELARRVLDFAVRS